ncbi:MAG: hypothetical protein KBG28_13670 [Kofleriaceae bacterium]|nr:hypothetical protein [Kofleriaceae bacterium]
MSRTTPLRRPALRRGRSLVLAAAGLLVATASHGQPGPGAARSAPSPGATADLGPALVRALTVGPADRLTELGQRGPSSALAAALGSADPVLRRAAIAAAPASADAWTLLPALAGVAAGWDRFAAVAAAEAALHIARHLGPTSAVGIEDDEVDAAQAGWRTLARAPTAWPRVRVAAVEITARLRALADEIPTLTPPVPGPAGLPPDLTELLADADPAVRRAAAEAVPAPMPVLARVPLAGMVERDPVPGVALAAAQALCGELAGGADAAPVLAALGPAGLARLAALLSAPDLAGQPAGAVIDAARCLAADDSAASRAALRAARVHAAPVARRLLPRGGAGGGPRR